MIVGCERCSTQFQLDDSRVPPDGVKVRCSRCKHAFEVFPKGAAPGVAEEAIHAIAERVAGSDGIPDATEDATGEAAREAPEAPDPDPTLEDDEPSWEFGDGFADLSGDPGDSGGGQARPGEAAALGPAGDVGSGLELAGPDRGEALADPAPEAEADGSDRNAASGLFDSDGLGEAAAPQLASEPAPRSGAGEEAGDELGSPIDWDLLEAGDAPSGGSGSSSIELAARPEAAGFTVSAEPAAAAAEPDAREIWVRRAATAAGWLATAGLCVAGLAQGLWPAPLSAAAPPAPGEGWELEQVEGRWIDHLSLGPVFAVSGEVRNTASATRPLPAFEVVWRDRSGAAVGRPTPLVLPRQEQVLREAPLPDSPNWRLTGRAVRAGAGARFLALPADLPYAAHHFEVRLRRAGPSG